MGRSIATFRIIAFLMKRRYASPLISFYSREERIAYE